MCTLYTFYSLHIFVLKKVFFASLLPNKKRWELGVRNCRTQPYFFTEVSVFVHETYEYVPL